MVPTAPSALRPWQRLSVRLAGFFAAVTVLAVALAGSVVYECPRTCLSGPATSSAV